MLLGSLAKGVRSMSEGVQAGLFHDMAYERLLAEINAKDDLAINLGDTLDVKASILLVVITFLATQTAYFLDKHTPGPPHFLLVGSGVLLAGSTIAAFVALWPREYMFPLPEVSGIDRASELRDFYTQHENVDARAMFAEFTKNEIGWAQSRISANQRKNRTKAAWLEWSFYFAAAAMVLNTATLVMRLF
jgi:hypothetical protein